MAYGGAALRWTIRNVIGIVPYMAALSSVMRIRNLYNLILTLALRELFMAGVLVQHAGFIGVFKYQLTIFTLQPFEWGLVSHKSWGPWLCQRRANTRGHTKMCWFLDDIGLKMP